MIRKRLSNSLNSKLILPFGALLLFFASSCNHSVEENKYNGKWILQDQNYNEDIIFKNGNYTKNYSSDDLRVNSSGKFYLNKNDNRTGITISLIPNKIISEKDTIFQECENLDIIEINDSIIVTQKPTQWIKGTNDKYVRMNETLIYKRF
ncbi:hypothetical protein [Flavobacterium foetidum]|uniref:hypothetical protein n=1 Tax=Flavobacterium foetidum TaxID=2026681 RepID=UPI001074D6E0|nr:hypothetical protein [Flavobacterium foetidum]KAF2514674.1 hypothetical protein E0W73_12035 [Flavobacterium foetidum]